MVEAGRAVYMVVVVVVVGWYSFSFMHGLNSHLSRHFISTIDAEMEQNPHMRRDLLEYRKRMEEQEQQQQQVKDLELQAKRIQEQLARLARPLPVKPGGATAQGFTKVTDDEDHDPSNQSWANHVEF